MVICPVCKQKLELQSGRVIAHGTNKILCYGSYMRVNDCKYAEPSIDYLRKSLGFAVIKSGSAAR